MTLEQSGFFILSILIVIGIVVFLFSIFRGGVDEDKLRIRNTLIKRATDHYPAHCLSRALGLVQLEIYDEIYTKAELKEPIQELIAMYFAAGEEKTHQAEIEVEASSLFRSDDVPVI